MLRRRRPSHEPIADVLASEAAQLPPPAKEDLADIWDSARVLRATAASLRYVDQIQHGARAIAQMAADLLGADVAAVNIVTDRAQLTVAGVGIEEIERTLDFSYCQHVVAEHQPVGIANSQVDPRVYNNAATIQDGLRSYLGVPLTTPDGYVIGALCVANYKTHRWNGSDLMALQRLASQLMLLDRKTQSDGAGAS